MVRWLLIGLLLSTSEYAVAQIYTCIAPDGSRVFSDEKCGPDAKLVPGITNNPKRATSAKPATVPRKSPAELDDLLERCNAGDQPACMTWSKGGGPNRLREQERELESSCEAGSLPACEQRYCRDGSSEDCRRRVLQLATLSGESWYLRFQQKLSADAPTTYSIGCLSTGSPKQQQATVSCAAAAGPERCRAGNADRAFPRLDAAAADFCSPPQ